MYHLFSVNRFFEQFNNLTNAMVVCVLLDIKSAVILSFCAAIDISATVTPIVVNVNVIVNNRC